MRKMPTTMVELLQGRAIQQPGRLAYRFLTDGEKDEILFTYQDLDIRARSIAGLLQSCAKPGERVLLIYPHGLDFIAAYFGCLYAKMIAVPVFPPHPARVEFSLPGLLRIMTDAGSSIALTNSSFLDAFRSGDTFRQCLPEMRLLVTDDPTLLEWAEKWLPVNVRASDLAFLQYTSGSTTTPKGVMVSHGNLMENMKMIERSFEVSEESHNVSWLPPYHDMGLIGGILQPLYTGMSCTILPYTRFFQRPLRWLEAISRFKATVSGGPNFSYELCLRKITPEQRDQLDLSQWNKAFNGAEPVFHKTLDRFAEYFAPCGFRRQAFLPCYGLAESTLMVTGGSDSASPKTIRIAQAGLAENKIRISSGSDAEARTLTGCGQVGSGQSIVITNPETLQPCGPGEVGEIWINGPSIAMGYWNKQTETEQTFRATHPGYADLKFLRTGDLGFICDGELYITGRIKNLIISGGKNYYAHDIEWSIESSHPSIQQGGSAVFSVCQEGPEQIIVIAEIRHRLPGNDPEIISAIRRAVSDYHGIQVDDIRLTPVGAIPRTTSGKKKHFLCRERYLAGALTEKATT